MAAVKQKLAPAAGGFTLVECLVTVLLLVILVTGVAPAMADFFKRNKLVTLHTELRTSLYLARTHAIQTGLPVTACPSGPGRQCSASSGDWSQGWMVFEDPDRTGQCLSVGNDGFCRGTHNRILEVRSPLEAGYLIRSNHHVSRRVRFSATGMSYGYNGRFTFCDINGTVNPVGLVVAATGRVRRARDSDLLSCP